MKKIQGFTLVEVIVVVAVLAAVLTIATPDMGRLFAKQAEMTETLRLRKIYDALGVYAKQHKQLPNKSTWYKDLAQYTDLSEEQLKKDVWGTDRKYEVFDSSVSYLGGSYKVYYATVFTNGLDRQDNGETLPRNKSEFASFDFKTTTIGNKTDNFAVKYTDQAYKIELLDETLNRMEKLSLALEKYARVKQITAISDLPNSSDKYIFFPEDKRSGDSGDYFKSGLTKETGGTVTLDESVGEIDGNANEATGLATKLGLPAYYGENALTDSTMWYISNPGPDGGHICNNERGEAPFYPPVIMIDDSGNPC